MIIIILLIILIVLNIIINIKLKKFYENYDNISMYSSVNGKCIKTDKYLGNNILGIPIKGYQSIDECNANNDKCQQYSNDKNTCLKQTTCGYCSNDKNQGMCLSSTPSGPIDLDYKCRPQLGSMSNNFTMGQPDEYIQPIIPVNTYPPTLPHPDIALDYNLIPMV